MKKIPDNRPIRTQFPKTQEQYEQLNSASYAELGHIHPKSYLDYLRENLKYFEKRHDVRMHNLFHTDRYLIEGVPRVDRYYSDFLKNTFFEVAQPYILDYKLGGFSRPHCDPRDRITTLTLLSDDEYEGGESLLQSDAYVPERLKKENVITEKDMLIAQERGENFVRLDNACPIIMPLKKDVTYAFGEHRMHGVTQVLKGHRLILVEWWRRDKNNKDNYE